MQVQDKKTEIRPLPREIMNPRTGQRMKILKTGAETNGKLLSIECYSPSSKIREPEHIHPYQENIFEILDGTLHFRIAGKIISMGRGEVVVIPANAPHHFWNESGKRPTISRSSNLLWILRHFSERILHWPRKIN